MFLGGIGTGKTNALEQIISQINRVMTQNDVMIIFDTKGDFYRSFYRPGDVVISNDENAAGPDGPDYWNIFYEIENDDRMEENIAEISKALFHQKLEKTNQPFFPQCRQRFVRRRINPFCTKQGYAGRGQPRAAKLFGLFPDGAIT
jgi:hypothetical protein